MTINLKDPGLRRKGIIIATGILSFAVVMSFFHVARKQVHKNGEKIKSAASAIIPLPSQEVNMKLRLQETLLKQSWGRDPFTHALINDNRSIRQSTEDASFNLTGILRRDGSRVAIINRYFVKEGDQVHGATVAEIRPDSVILTRDNREIVLKIGGA